jgi:hypothetical protein
VTQIFLTGSGAVTAYWPDPGNWNPTHTIECVSCGGTGSAGNSGMGVSGNGGIGGAYAIANNLSLTFPVPYCALGQSAGVGGYATNFNSTSITPITTPGTVSAGANFYPAGNVGGNVGQGQGTYNAGGGGGGGAGPHGAGQAGTQATSASAAGQGGSGDAGSTPGGAAGGVSGASGTQWDASHGIGAGGGGAQSTLAAGTGGNYGGGGGGGQWSGQKSGGSPGLGLIVITYTPYTPPPPAGAYVAVLG